jgi:NAD(P)-dependent dehydrogenase (short-subunit alcohol dehydrogenase family)
LKLSVHSGSDKFSLYPIINRLAKKHRAGLHVKTAGTTWLEEIIGLAEAGGEGLRTAPAHHTTLSMKISLFDLTGENAVVIGATGVLGGAIAEGLALAGAQVAVLGRNRERGESRVRSIRNQGETAEFFQADALDRESLEAARKELSSQLGPPTILVNAAGGNDPRVIVTPEQPFEKISADAWRENFDLNLVGGVLLPCQEFGPAMKERGRGSIINIASASAHIPLSRVAAYSAAKAALLNLTLFLAREWAPSNIRVNSITPGFFFGEQNRRLLVNEDGSITARGQMILGHTPMGRFGKETELVGATVFLASERASSFVTGIDIRVDGGFLSQTI